MWDEICLSVSVTLRADMADICHLSISGLTVPIIISPPQALLSTLFVSTLEPNPRIVAGVSVCLFSVAAHSVSLTTHFDLTSFHAVMVHFGNIHHEEREIP